MKPRPVIPAAGQVGEFYFGSAVQTEVIFLAETDFRPAVAGGQLVALDQGEVDHAFLRPEVGCPHDDHAALDITQTCVAVAVIFFVILSGQHEWPTEKSQDHHAFGCFFHLHSPYSNPIIASRVPSVFPWKSQILSPQLS
jgi:hypothetical protein